MKITFIGSTENSYINHRPLAQPPLSKDLEPIADVAKNGSCRYDGEINMRGLHG